MTRQDAVDKVRKLHRLAGSPNAHEAALAASTAQTLIDRYQVQPSELREETALEVLIRQLEHSREVLRSMQTSFKKDQADAVAALDAVLAQHKVRVVRTTSRSKTRRAQAGASSADVPEGVR